MAPGGRVKTVVTTTRTIVFAPEDVCTAMQELAARRFGGVWYKEVQIVSASEGSFVATYTEIEEKDE